MPPKKAAPVVKQIPTKQSFFEKKRVMQEVKSVDPVQDEKKPVPQGPKRRFLYAQGTGVAYAEVVGDVAICMETGLEMFRFGSRDENDFNFESTGVQRRFNFAPPTGKRHPDDKFIDVLGLVKAGILSDFDVASGRAFSDAELHEFMSRLQRTTGSEFP